MGRRLVVQECEHGPERSHTDKNDCQGTKRILVHQLYKARSRTTRIIVKFNLTRASLVTTLNIETRCTAL